MSDRRNQATRRVDQPEPGYFRIRLVKGGAWVAAEIRCVDGVWQAFIDGTPQEPSAADPVHAEGVFRIWHYGERIAPIDHLYMIQYASYSRLHRPNSPEANPTRPINVGHEPPAF